MSIQQQYRSRAKELLQDGSVKMVIGYGEGTTATRRRPIFITNPDDTDRLVLDAACKTNLAGYLLREGLLADQKSVAIFLSPSGVRTINILASESQLSSAQVVVLGFQIQGDTVKALEGTKASDFSPLIAKRKEKRKAQPSHEMTRKLEQMTPAERFAFWEGEFRAALNVTPAVPHAQCAGAAGAL